MIGVTARIESELGKGGAVRAVIVPRVIAFAVSTAMDTDADIFSVDIGDPNSELSWLRDRDIEVRMSILAGQGEQIERLNTGIADKISFNSDDQIMSFFGRDLSCVAADSAAKPGQFTSVMPHKFVGRRATELKLHKQKLSKVKPIPKIYTDGSETEWAFWYRMYRKRKCWMWFSPDGVLHASPLAYSNSPEYYFGRPPERTTTKPVIPVKLAEITKSTEGRVAEALVYYENAYGAGKVIKKTDPGISKWLRRPTKIISLGEVSAQDAKRAAFDEVYDGLVGSVEISLTVTDADFVIQQNSMATVNIPEYDIVGDYFIVGVELRGSSDGLVQVVRLREKGYALPRRVPDDPKLIEDNDRQANMSDVASMLETEGIRWGSAFAQAAEEHHGGWDRSLFLGVMLAMCSLESSFRNVRNPDTGGEWVPQPVGGFEDVLKWKKNFANEAGNPYNPRNPNPAAVGPMQLYTQSYKDKADAYAGKVGEYDGGRWIPESNIRAAGYALKNKLDQFAGDPGNPANIWIGVKRYNGDGSAADAYQREVKLRYERDYKVLVEEVYEAGAEIAIETIASDQGYTVRTRDDGGRPFTVLIPENAPKKTKAAVLYMLNQLGKPYLWGASGPDKFDCSGLFYRGYAEAGYDFGRTNTHNYWANNSWRTISRENLVCGDAVFFNDVEHMGIYLNDNHMIHAPSTGDVVKISAITGWRNDSFVGAKRPIEWRGIAE